MRRHRLIAMPVGALTAAALVTSAALLLPSQSKRKQTLPVMSGCQRYFLIPVEWICGKQVFWVNPDGSRVLLGSSDQLRMPRPRPFRP